MKVEDVEGIGPTYGARLHAAGVATVEALLERGKTRKGREDLAATTGIDGTRVLTWVNHADLMRINGVGSEYADLLEAAGVDSPAELAHRVAANLAAKMEELNTEKELVRRVPTQSMVGGWIEEAKSLPKIVEH